MTTWENLTHDKILDTVEKTIGKKLSNLLLPRNSYINRVFELEEHDSRERFIVKFYRPGRWTEKMILEEHNFLQELADKEVPVIPPLPINNQTLFPLATQPPSNPAAIYYSLFQKKSGRALDEFNQESWEEIGRLIARIHLVGATHKESKRVKWQPAVATRHHLEVLLNSSFLLEDFKPAFKKSVEEFIKKADPLFNESEFLLLHGDCHKGNLIHRPGEGIYIVDFDDLCFGPAIQDIWLLLPDLPENCKNELSYFLKGYEVFRQFDYSSLELAPYLRGMRIIHFSAWLAVQSSEPGFNTHFPDAGTAKYWNELIKDLQEIVYR